MTARVAASLFALALTAGLASASSANAAEGVKVGILSCHISGGIGYVIASSKSVHCVFRPSHYRWRDRYVGSISKFGADLGMTTGGHLYWTVFAPGSLRRGSLAGSYFGATGEATVGVGTGVNVLVGGFRHSVNLQPVSVQFQTGLNVAGGVASLTLHKQRKN